MPSSFLLPRSASAGACHCRPRRALLAGLLLCALGTAPAAVAAVIRVGPQEAITRIAEAARLAQDGDTVLVMPGQYRGDVAVWHQKRLAIRGVGTRPVLVADGRSAEGKAIWVIRNGEFLIDNIAFRGARVADGNGAGIRFEHGRLEIRNCSFADNEHGVLTANFADAELIVRDSVFADAPHSAGGLHHLLYVGRIGRFELTGSRFEGGYEGHLVKSRARLNEIRYNLIYDGPAGHASYELDLPNGGVANVVGNIIGQGAGTRNPVVVAYGAEGYVWPRNALRLAHNTLVSERATGAWFLRVWEDGAPTPPEVRAVNNLTVGLGIFTLGAPGEFRGNYPAWPTMLGEPARLDFTLAADSILRGRVAPLAWNDPLRPRAEFRPPVGTRRLVPPPRWVPGALQSDGERPRSPVVAWRVVRAAASALPGDSLK